MMPNALLSPEGKFAFWFRRMGELLTVNRGLVEASGYGSSSIESRLYDEKLLVKDENG